MYTNRDCSQCHQAAATTDILVTNLNATRRLNWQSVASLRLRLNATMTESQSHPSQSRWQPLAVELIVVSCGRCACRCRRNIVTGKPS